MSMANTVVILDFETTGLSPGVGDRAKPGAFGLASARRDLGAGFVDRTVTLERLGSSVTVMAWV